ncbi:MAG: serine/threonine-protein kinase [Myxococcota bacterium]
MKVVLAEAAREFPEQVTSRSFKRLQEELERCVESIMVSARSVLLHPSLADEVVQLRRSARPFSEISTRISDATSEVVQQIQAMLESWQTSVEHEFVEDGAVPTVLMWREGRPSVSRIEHEFASVSFLPGIPRGQDGRVGTVIGERYRIKRLVARSTLSTVYEARHLQTGAPVALKLLTHDARSADALQSASRFKREARLLGRLSTPRVVRVFDCGEDALGLYLAMEWVLGQTLQSRLSASGPLSMSEAVALGVQIARGLAEAHELGIIHRDVKPSNIMLLPRKDQFEIKLIDFGVGKEIADTAQLTIQNVLVGSPQFMAPEQIRGRAVDGRTDQYAFGVTLFNLLTAEFPFPQMPFNSMLLAHLSRTPRSLVEALGDSDDATARCSQIIARCMEKEPASRFRDMSELIDALARVPKSRSHHSTVSQHDQWSGEGGASRASRSRASQRRRRMRLLWRWSFLVVVGGLAWALGAGLVIMGLFAGMRMQHVFGQ